MQNDADREAFYQRKKKEIMDRLLGPETPYPIPSDVETQFTSKLAGTKKTWYECKRIINNPNPSAFDPWLREFNHEMHVNNGRTTRVIEEPLGDVVPPPVK